MLPAGQGWITLNDALEGLGDFSPVAVTGDFTGVTWTVGQRDWAIVWSSGEPTELPDGTVDGVVDATGAQAPATSPWARPRCWSAGHWATISRAGWSTGAEVCGADFGTPWRRLRARR